MTASTPNSPKDAWPAPSPPTSPIKGDQLLESTAPAPQSRKLPTTAPMRPHQLLGATMADGLEHALLSTSQQARLFHDLSALLGMEEEGVHKQGSDDACLPGLPPLPAPPFADVALHGAAAAASPRLPLLGGLAQLTGLVALPGHDQPTPPLTAPPPLAEHALKRWQASPPPLGGSMSNAAVGGRPAQWPLAATRWKVPKRPPSAPPRMPGAPAAAPAATAPPRVPPNKTKGPSKKGACVWKAAITL